MKSKTFLKVGSCLLVCLTGLSFSFSFGAVPNNFACSANGCGDPTPLPPNPPPPPPPLGISLGMSLS